MTGSMLLFISEFRLEAVQLVVDQGSTVKAAAVAMSVGKSGFMRHCNVLEEFHDYPDMFTPLEVNIISE
jgi:hypothetical protein